ncbi:hypothetical protein C2845_PM07G31820 [Panicum miliaceum]|uniref:DUF6598 domain-containing protein n=1 Tax=Panicum miliaceum TaxID=4540 RepID=A0A3L6SJP5_PANMI|nr:hypothetical protein C2845_PM07G31820 [Panicum miliaceum]
MYSVIKTISSVSRLSEVDLMFAYVKKALEGTIEIRVLSGPDEAFDGKITARTTDVPHHTLLYDSDVDEAITLGDDRVLRLLRRVVAVSKGELLMISICCRSGDQSAGTAHCVCEFAPRTEGADRCLLRSTLLFK